MTQQAAETVQSSETPQVTQAPRRHAAQVMDRAAADGHVTLEARAEQVRLETRARFGGFVLDRVNPGSRLRNRDNEPFDTRLFEEAGELGLLQFALPAEIGGAGRDKFDWGVVVAEVARLARDPGFPVMLDISVENTELLLASGRPELIDRYVPDLAAGRRFAVQGAYESRDPYDYQTTARFEDGQWILSGAKRFVAAAVIASLFVLYVRDEASNDMLAFLVERDDPGVTVAPLETMGLRTMGLGQVLLHDVRLPEWRLVWRADALSELNTYARNRRMMSACGVLGAMEGIVEACVESLATRKRTGRRVLDYPNVERSVGEMRVLIESARSTIYRALDGTRTPGRDPYFDAVATAAKHQASECAIQVGRLVMNLQGGESYMSAFPWEGYMRDVLGLIGGQGSQELLLIQLGQRSIVGLEGRALREDGAQRTVSRLADAWWALAALRARQADDNDANSVELSDALTELLKTVGVDQPTDDVQRAGAAAFFERAGTLIAATARPDGALIPDVYPSAPNVAESVPGADAEIGSRLAELTAQAWAFVACVVAVRTNLLTRLLQPATVHEAADRAALPVEFTRGLLDVLVRARIVRTQNADHYVTDEGMERLLVGGPRTSAFTSRLSRALAGASELLTPAQPSLPVSNSAGHFPARQLSGSGGDAPLLAEVLAESLLGRLESLDALLSRPDARIGCAARDSARTAYSLAAQLPGVSVLALAPDASTARSALAAYPRLPTGTGAPIDVRDTAFAGFEPADQLALAWLPIAGLRATEQSRAVREAAEALLPGGWLVLACPLAPKRALGAAVTRVESILAGGSEPPTAEALETLLRDAGCGHIRTLWEDVTVGVRLLAARRPPQR